MKIRKDLISCFFMRVLKRNLTRSAPLNEVMQFLNSLAPFHNGFELILVGGGGDGSYLLPNDLNNIDRCISPGYGGIAKFEIDLWSRYGIKSVIIDPISEPVIINPGITHIEKFVGARNSQNWITLNEILKEYSQDCILQMDIEGGEYITLLGLDTNSLKKFRIIVLELHDLHFMTHQWFLDNILKSAFFEILQLFDVVNVKSSTVQTFSIEGMDLPDTFEITLHRKDRASQLVMQNFHWSQLSGSFK